MLDAVFLSRVTNKTVHVNVSASTFPVFYQQQSVQSRQVRQTLYLTEADPIIN